MGLQLTHSAASVNAVGFLEFGRLCVSWSPRCRRSKCWPGRLWLLPQSPVWSWPTTRRSRDPGSDVWGQDASLCIAVHPYASLAFFFDPFASVKIQKMLGELDIFPSFCFSQRGAGCRHQLAGRCLELSMTCSQSTHGMHDEYKMNSN